MSNERYDYDYYDSEMNHISYSIEVYEEAPTYEYEYQENEGEKVAKELKSTHSSLDTMESYSITINDLEEKSDYEIQWLVGSERKCVFAKFDGKILNCDPRYMHDDGNYYTGTYLEESVKRGQSYALEETGTEIDLLFCQTNNGNLFTIHSDLVEEGIVEFYPIVKTL
jgi:hypothetical protein